MALRMVACQMFLALKRKLADPGSIAKPLMFVWIGSYWMDWTPGLKHKTRHFQSLKLCVQSLWNTSDGEGF